VRGHTVVRVLKQRWPNRPIDLLVTSLCARWSITCPAFALGSSGPAPGRLAVARQRGLAALLLAAITAPRWCCPGLEIGDCAGAGRHSPSGGFCREARFGDQPMARGEKALPRFIDKNAALALRTGRRCRRNGRCRSLMFPPEKRPLAAAQRAGHGPRRGAGARSVGASTLTYYPEAAAAGRKWPGVWWSGPRRKGDGGGDRGVGGPRVAT